jgi:hypothetical protein
VLGVASSVRRGDWTRIMRAGRLCFFAMSVASSLFLVDGTVSGQSRTPAKDRPLAFGTCDRESPMLVGEKPVRTGNGKKVKAPRKLRDAKPKYPVDSQSRTLRGAPWVGEMLVDTDGKVRRVWTLREVEATPPWPEFNQAIITAIGQWLFEPTVVQGRRVPVCMTVTVGILLQ